MLALHREEMGLRGELYLPAHDLYLQSNLHCAQGRGNITRQPIQVEVIAGPPHPPSCSVALSSSGLITAGVATQVTMSLRDR